MDDFDLRFFASLDPAGLLSHPPMEAPKVKQPHSPDAASCARTFRLAPRRRIAVVLQRRAQGGFPAKGAG